MEESGRMDESMKNETVFYKKKMEQEYPRTTKRMQDMIKIRISEQVGAERAEQICVALPKQTVKKSAFREPLKWVAAAVVVLVCGTSVAAAANPELKRYLLERFAVGDVDAYMQNVSPEVNENTDGENNAVKDTLNQSEVSLEKPLWEISNAWYDGVTLYFSATPSEEAKKMSDKYHMNPSDHCTVNGQDTLLECSDAESGEGDLSEGEKTGQYHFQVNLGEKGISGDMDVSFCLNISLKDKSIPGCTRQEIQFRVEENDTHIKVVESPYQEVELEEGKVEILEFALAPSALCMRVKYTFFGADAKEKIEQLYGEDGNVVYGCYYIEDSFGNRMLGGHPAVYEEPDIEKGADGSYSITFVWETEGVNHDTESLTFSPYIEELGSDGKSGPGSEHMLDWAVFTVPVAEVK